MIALLVIIDIAVEWRKCCNCRLQWLRQSA